MRALGRGSEEAIESSPPSPRRWQKRYLLKSMRPLSLIVFILAGFPPSVSVAESVDYGKMFSFKEPKIHEFSDFRLQFIGQKPGAFFPGSTSHRLGDVYQFRVIEPPMDQVVEWSSGTGDIGPTTFKVHKKCFWLELMFSDTFGRLSNDQAVISQRDKPADCGQDEEVRSQTVRADR